MSAPPDVRLFSYGTLQSPDVQLAIFGRLLTGQAAALTGFRLATISISDPDSISISGKVEHVALIPAPDEARPIEGVALEITAAELAAADQYEGVEYRRIEVDLSSGAKAWVYVMA
jgi:gamma-glutamylcyclotransferase (GGCT)/AIG2-like uncharacterized protein YtfP